MVKVVAVHTRETKEGKPFIVLEIHGDIELMQSSITGKFYATNKKCFMPSTFTEEMAKSFIGTTMDGEIIRVDCESYNFKIPQTGEIVKLCHTYQYVPQQKHIKERERQAQQVTI